MKNETFQLFAVAERATGPSLLLTLRSGNIINHLIAPCIGYLDSQTILSGLDIFRYIIMEWRRPAGSYTFAIKPNLGNYENQGDFDLLIDKFRGTEAQGFFEKIRDGKINDSLDNFRFRFVSNFIITPLHGAETSTYNNDN